jgi:hypothetical protein
MTLVGIAFLLDTESARHPSKEFRLKPCNLPGLIDLCRLDVLSKSQLATVLERTLATGVLSRNEGGINSSGSIWLWDEYQRYTDDDMWR